MDTAAVAASVAVLGKALPKKILLVDDDELELELMADRLSSSGFEITCAKNGQEALTIFQQQWFPVILTDWNMPLMDGMALTEQLRERGHDEIYIIMLSGRDDSAAYERGYYAGVDDYLSKHLPDPELLARIEGAFRILTLRRSLKQARDALETSSTQDTESDAYAMTHLINQLNSEIKRSKRYERNLSVLVLSADPKPNETPMLSGARGLPFDSLRNIVRALQGAIRLQVDWIGRYHSESNRDCFAIVLPETGPAEAAVVRQRVRGVCERLSAGLFNPLEGVTFNLGLASLNLQEKNSALDAAGFLRVAQLCCQCAAAPENHLRAVQASIEAGVLIPCRMGYALSPYCQAEK